MQIDAHSPARLTASPTTPDRFNLAEQSGMTHGAPRWIGMTHEPLAACAEAAALQIGMQTLACELIGPSTAVAVGAALRANLFPALVDTSWLQSPVARPAVAEDRRRERLAIVLHEAFETDPLESGFDHPAESIIAEALQTPEREQALEWIRAIALDASDPSFAALVLRCLGRIERPGTSRWRAGLIADALRLDEVQIRDAAAQAAESWADGNLTGVLATHEEPVPWLRQYVSEVVSDLRALA